MRVMLVIIVVGILAIAGYGAYSVRTVYHDPEVWHVDPRTAPDPETPNFIRVAPRTVTDLDVAYEPPIFEIDASTLAQAFDDFVMDQPRVERIGGSVEAGWVTYVQTTDALRFPDYISVQFYDLGDTEASTLSIFSRSRFGYSDMGVNANRVEAWLKAIDTFTQ